MTPFRFLDSADVAAAGGLDMAAAVADIRAAIALWRSGAAEMPSETSVALGGSPQARAYALPARLGSTDAGVKWAAHRGVADGLPATVALTLVSDAQSGLPLGLVESASLTTTRTAAVSALALLHAASAPIRRVALLGAGAQAAAHLRMLAALFPQLEAVRCWNRTPARVEAMLSTQPTPWPVTPAGTLEAATETADAVISCTAAVTPILRPGVMQRGRIVVQTGYHEAEFDLIDRADAVVVDLWGEFSQTSAKSLFQMHRAGRFPASRVAADLPMLLLDGWRSPPDAAVYVSSFGLNLFDIALAGRVLRSAASRGIGQVLSLG